MDTINRLLKKQAPKRRGKISAAELAAAQTINDDPTTFPLGTTSEERDVDVERANSVYVRWVSDAGGCRLGVPGEWLEGPVVGWMRGDGVNRGRGQRGMVMEVEG